ncbi:uracil-DNA glycosylase [Methylobacillus arboreus]|uniref:uracil-DNA glycosylase n=1 Tax=Methylobacillus arboreus TaxID=755170 RepID=UPI001E574C5C|nr:uracil-DNA glycosylase [Methylobacillus arboreus]MCB5191188.1 uracil-DNA glycosylase [Methylobacillus arboreus]
MSLTREDILRELELLPVWRLRTQPETPKPKAEPDAAVSSSVPDPIASSSVPDAPAVTEHPLAVEAEPEAPASNADEPLAYFDEAMPAWPEYAESMTPDWAEPELLAEAPGKDRRADIMGMDWQALQASVKECTACILEKTRTQTVFGVGDPNAEWLFIGEAPGAEEDRRGEPFVGPAGQLLDSMLAAIALKRGDNVYIANVLKCRPPANRNPHGEEVVKCDPYLKRQVELIKPRLIVALGKFAAQSLLASDNSIASLRGKLHDFHGVPVIVTYHPAYLLRNLPDKARAWDDLCFARETMRGLQSAASSPSAE